jgi:hypothetical protein
VATAVDNPRINTVNTVYDVEQDSLCQPCELVEEQLHLFQVPFRRRGRADSMHMHTVKTPVRRELSGLGVNADRKWLVPKGVLARSGAVVRHVDVN